MRSKNAKLNITTNVILNIITIIYGFIVPKIIISHFGSNVNGLVSSVTQFLAYIALLESGFGPVIKAKLYKPLATKNNKELVSILKVTEKFFRKIAAIFIIYILILCIFYPLLINSNFNLIFTISLILIISISTFAEYFFGMTYRLFLQADQKSYVISFIQIISYILSIIAVIYFAYINSSIQIIKLITALIFVMRPIIQNLYVKRKYKINFNNYDSNYKLDNKWDGLAQHIAAVIHGNTDITLLTLFSTFLEVSVYSVYNLIINGIKSFIQSFTNGIEGIFGNMIANNEKDNLNKKFKLYEIGYFSICTIIFSTTMIMIVPFVEVFTKGITDVNYSRHLFGTLLVISEFVWAIRLPYISLTYSAGHFKETRIGAWIECLVNIVVSIILVNKLGIVGVTIGTLIAMIIRAVEFIYHANKYILKRNILENIKILLVVISSFTLIIFICNFLPLLNNINYLNWIINASWIFIISMIIVLLFDVLFYKKELVDIFQLFKRRK